MSKPPPHTFVARSPAQQQALASPQRLEIIGHFTVAGGLSVADLAERIGRPPTAIYYHVRVLERAGLLVKVGERHSAKRPEALYRPVAERIAMATEAGSGKSTGRATKAMAAAFRMAVRDMEEALEQQTGRVDGKHRNLYGTRLHFRVSRATLAEINEHLRAIERIAMRSARLKEPPPDADQYVSLTMALMPLRGRQHQEPPD